MIVTRVFLLFLSSSANGMGTKPRKFDIFISTLTYQVLHTGTQNFRMPSLLVNYLLPYSGVFFLNSRVQSVFGSYNILIFFDIFVVTLSHNLIPLLIEISNLKWMRCYGNIFAAFAIVISERSCANSSSRLKK